MNKHDIPIPQPVPTKPVLLDLIKAKNIPAQYKVDLIAQEFGFEVLRLPPYHCVLNPIEMVWNQFKSHARRMNVFTSEPAKVVQMIRDVFKEKILPSHCVNYDRHIRKEEETFKKMDGILDTHIDPFIIQLTDSEEDDED